MFDEKIAIVTLLRKGSKRFSGKNIAPLIGDPLYMWTVKVGIDLAHLLGCNYYLAHDYDKLELPEDVCEIKRKPEFAGDEHKTGEEILSFDLGADVYIFLQVTSPFRDISKMMEWTCHFLNDKALQSGFAAYPLKGFIYSKLGEDAFPMNFMQQERTDNGCEKRQWYKETGSFYIFRKAVLGMKHILDAAPKRIYVDPFDIDIDTPEDLRRAEKI